MPRFVTSYCDPDTPYRWLRGNHHGHSTVSDGHLSPEENVRLYEEAGYDYLAFSEHDTLLDVKDVFVFAPIRRNLFLLCVAVLRYRTALSK